MPRVDLVRDLDDRDFRILCEFVRFGALIRRQIDLRYGDDLSPAVVGRRLGRLATRGFIREHKELGFPIPFYAATAVGARLVRRETGLAWAAYKARQLGHDLALVDLADHWKDRDKQSRWSTEREVRTNKLVSLDPGHWPDGLLETHGMRLAIELERSAKKNDRYEEIHRWFARATRIDGIRWYVATSAIRKLVERSIARQGLFGLNVEIDYIPDDVEVFP